jgi:hypothetical protein
MKPFNDAILSLRQDDGFLSKEDIDSLKNMVLSAKSGRMRRWVDSENQVNMDSLAGYICKTLSDRWNIAQDRQSVMNPISDIFNINFFVKNTANMNGYIRARGFNNRGQFQDALFGLLADLRANFRNGEIILNYVNTVVSHTSPYDNVDAVGKYIHKINRDEFAAMGRTNRGNTGSTDFDVVFGHVLNTVDKNNIAILAAEFVFSPGGVEDVQRYLERQRNSIRVRFSEKIQELDLAVLVLKMESDFDGNYWNRRGQNVGRLTATRPYYIWFIGHPQHLTKIAGNERLFVALKSNGFTGDRVILESSDMEKQPEFRIAASEKYSFDNSSRTIRWAKRPGRGENVSFSLDVNFMDAFRDSAFFADPDNYEVGNYELSVNARPPRNFKHRLTLTSEKLMPGATKITVMGRIPEWVNSVHSEDDTNILRDTSEQAKTFGFRHIVGGAYEAFYPAISMNERHVLQTINLNIGSGR